MKKICLSVSLLVCTTVYGMESLQDAQMPNEPNTLVQARLNRSE